MIRLAELDPLSPDAFRAIPDGSTVSFEGVSLFDAESIRKLAGRGITTTGIERGDMAGQLVRTLMGTSRAREITADVMTRPAKRNARYNRQEQRLLAIYEAQKGQKAARG